jgi:hypothetical protein
MGDLTETLRETELKVSKLLMHKGEYSEDTNAQLFKKSDVYKDLTVGGTTVKAKFAVAVARWFKKNVMNHLVSRVSDKYADKVRELATQVTDLNKELTGSDMLAPKNEEEVRYHESLDLMSLTLKKTRKMDRNIVAINKMIDEKSKAMFGDDSDDSGGETEGTYNVDTATEIKSLKGTKKTLESEKLSVIKDFYTRASGGLYNADDKGAGTKLTMPSSKVGSSGKTFVAKMLYYTMSQPQKFGFCMHEIRRVLKDYNKRKGTYYVPKDNNEVDEKLREKFATSNSALYKDFENNVPAADFSAARRSYCYGTNGGSSSDPWPCAEGNGLRVLHFFITRLVKVDCEHIEGIEADLMDCPGLFGMGDPQKAVDKVNQILDEAERVDAQVGYRVVLRICDVLSKRHALFGGLHSEKLKPSAITERRNARPEMVRLMTDISTILINIGEGGNWKANQVNVDMGTGYRVFNISKHQEGRSETSRGLAEINQVQKAPANKRKAEEVNAIENGTKQECVYEKCNRFAFCHKKERGGQVHGSKMCFDHFLLGVEDSKLSKPIGIPIKGGKTMIAKRGEDKKWEYKVFNIRLKIHDEMSMLRSKTFLSGISNRDADELLSALHIQFEQSNDGKLEIYHTELVNESNEVKWENLTEEYSGSFDLPNQGSIVPIFDIKKQRTERYSSTQNLYQDEYALGEE